MYFVCHIVRDWVGVRIRCDILSLLIEVFRVPYNVSLSMDVSCAIWCENCYTYLLCAI